MKSEQGLQILIPFSKSYFLANNLELKTMNMNQRKILKFNELKTKKYEGKKYKKINLMKVVTQTKLWLFKQNIKISKNNFTRELTS